MIAIPPDFAVCQHIQQGLQTELQPQAAAMTKTTSSSAKHSNISSNKQLYYATCETHLVSCLVVCFVALLQQLTERCQQHENEKLLDQHQLKELQLELDDARTLDIIQMPFVLAGCS